MKIPILIIVLFLFSTSLEAQKRRPAVSKVKTTSAQKHREIGGTAIVIDETLSV
ncbi:MAG: hypothetical protein H0V90_10835, partial [Blastocatellia bacterium]|nr:hypothetical protein [Blastocatellia bacterium]